VDADSIVDAVKSMIEEYNSMIEMVNKEVKTKPDRDYEPLTSEQKKELSEDEIEAWEKKAKEGLLYADSDIRSLTSDLRFIIDGGIAQELAEMGISTSTSYSDNGKINFDESKFRAALASDPERVQELFAESSVKNTNGNGYSKGIGANLKSVLDKYVNTTGAMTSKGILIRKAGHESSPMSVTENTMYNQLKAIKEQISKLQERLETERDRYIKQFTSLETLISQMNNQSSWLSQFGG
ncbi:MAG: flagellar filament capping protein FliD, partial [Lachnospiraceae bacterium]|nr:flagellar filament capping protein FliD [Lachnospiraceae bacterium]